MLQEIKCQKCGAVNKVEMVGTKVAYFKCDSCAEVNKIASSYKITAIGKVAFDVEHQESCMTYGIIQK